MTEEHTELTPVPAHTNNFAAKNHINYQAGKVRCKMNMNICDVLSCNVKISQELCHKSMPQKNETLLWAMKRWNNNIMAYFTQTLNNCL